MIDFEQLKQDLEAATPGDWHEGEMRPNHSHHIRSIRRHWSIAVLRGGKGCTNPSKDILEAENSANARLLVMAKKTAKLALMVPELRSAVEDAKAYAEEAVEADGGIDHCEITHRVSYERARDALAKLDALLGEVAK